MRSWLLISLSLTVGLTILAGRASAAAPDAVGSLPFTRLKFGSVALYSENDKYFAGTDRNYTNGFKLSFLSTDLKSLSADPVPKPIQQLARTFSRVLPAGREYKLGLALGQNIYTPTDTELTTYQPNDRPYAAWGYVSAAFHVFSPPPPSAIGGLAQGQLDTLEVSIGVVGPGALGRQVQNNIHHLIGVETAKGWAQQIHNEPGLQVGYERKLRLATPEAELGWGADLIPHAGVTLGNVFTYLNAGAEVRLGWRLPGDFGTHLIRPSGDSNPRRRPAFSLFGFAASDSRLVARDLTLQGNSFRASPSIGAKHFVSDVHGGLAVATRHWQFTYSQAARSREFVGQEKRSVFGSFSATFYY